MKDVVDGVPTQEEVNECTRKVEEHWNKAKIAYGTSMALAVSSLAFPPASAGAVVVALEGGRQVIQEGLTVIKFSNKFPKFGKR